MAIYRQFPSRANKWNDANFTLSDTFLIDWLKRKDVSSVKVNINQIGEFLFNQK